MQREYTIKAVFDSPRGKWPSSLPNSIFLDSRKFFAIYSAQLFDNIVEVMEREMLRDPTGRTNGMS